eukprot:2983415-Pyramimonas_sp.AAC.1
MAELFRKDLLAERKTARGPTQPDGPPPTRLRLTAAAQDDPVLAHVATIAEQAGAMEFNPFRHAT